MASNVRLSLKEWTEGWTKWDIALYVGAPVALGLAGIWFYRRSKSQPDDNDESRDEISEETESRPSPSKSATPLEKAQAAKAKGNKYFKGGKYDQAIACYTEAIDLCPSDKKSDLATFYQNRAASSEYLSKYESVIADCTEAIKLNSKYTKAFGRRCKAYQQVGKLKESLEDITTACILEGFANQVNLQLADQVLKDLGRKCAKDTFKNRKPVLPSKFFVKNYFNGFANDPVKNFKPKVSMSTQNEKDVKGEENDVKAEGDTTPFEQAVENLNNNEIKDIIDLCTQEIIGANSSYINLALLLRGTFYMMSGQTDLAGADFETLISAADVDPRIKTNAVIKESSILIQREKITEAFDIFDEGIKVDPDNSDIYHHRGQQYLVVDKLEQALDDFNKSIKLSPDFPTSHVQKAYAVHRTGIVYQQQSSLTEASKMFQETIIKFPQYADAYLMYAQSLSDQSKFEESLNNFDKALELAPDNPNIYVHKGLLMVQYKGQFEDGSKLVEKAIQIDPKCEYAYEIMGTIDVQRGKMPQALESFKKAINLSRSEAEMAHLHSLLNAAQAQVTVAQNLGIPIPSMG
ncbi:hypothetical protein LOTGIDRAFT_105182 [Lottia gigantea]|uniref:Mitochondrial import receptor subunit TOM70 n=1 Tax=Lottia gigantea TaxID=225164 RepID=V4AFI9_LOTGI|nr:hypothetical protein LOTGIDRAFT_105182 [Lottia gigantea]ESO93870.1 hypothetical protein LOTGIDRAFT_105182 [Lottia gigantea]